MNIIDYAVLCIICNCFGPVYFVNLNFVNNVVCGSLINYCHQQSVCYSIATNLIQLAFCYSVGLILTCSYWIYKTAMRDV